MQFLQNIYNYLIDVAAIKKQSPIDIVGEWVYYLFTLYRELFITKLLCSERNIKLWLFLLKAGTP